MGLMSRARVLGYKSVPIGGGRSYLYLPHGRRRRARRIVSMGVFTRTHQPADPSAPRAKWAAADVEMSSRFPALTEYLTEALTEEGKVRVTSTLLVSCEDGMWKGCLTDRAQPGGNSDYKLWRSGDTLQSMLEAIDSTLQEGRPDWRKFPAWSKGNKR